MSLYLIRNFNGNPGLIYRHYLKNRLAKGNKKYANAFDHHLISSARKSAPTFSFEEADTDLKSLFHAKKYSQMNEYFKRFNTSKNELSNADIYWKVRLKEELMAHDEVIQIFRYMEDTKYPVSQKEFSIFLHSLSTMIKYEDWVKYFQDLISLDQEIDEFILGRISRCYQNLGNTEALLNYFDLLVNKHVIYNNDIYNPLIEHCVQNNKLEEARNMIEKLKSSSLLPFPQLLVPKLLQIECKIYNKEGIMELIDTMSFSSENESFVKIYSTALHFSFHNEEHEMTERLFQKLSKIANKTLVNEIFEIILCQFSLKHEYDKVISFVNYANLQEFSLSTRCVLFLCKANIRLSFLDEANANMKAIKEDQDFMIDVQSMTMEYRSMMVLCLSVLGNERESLEMINRIICDGLNIDPSVIHYGMNAFVRNGGQDDTILGLHLIEEAEKHNYIGRKWINRMIDICIRISNFEKAIKLFHEAYELDIKLNFKSYVELLAYTKSRIKCSDSTVLLVNSMRQYDLKRWVYEAGLQACLERKEIELGSDIGNEMMNKRVYFSRPTLKVFERILSKSKNIDSLKRIISQSLEHETKLDTKYLKRRVFTLLLERGSWNEAISLMDSDLKRKDGSVSYGLFRQLVNAMVEHGESAMAIKIVQRALESGRYSKKFVKNPRLLEILIRHLEKENRIDSIAPLLQVYNQSMHAKFGSSFIFPQPLLFSASETAERSGNIPLLLYVRKLEGKSS